jgi:hypothetical protein
MMSSWWFLWMAVMFMLLVPPLGYGWGYRGWGPPYPSYLQRRRRERAIAANSVGGVDHYAWGWGGDLMWILVLVGTFWAVTLLWR